MNKIFNVVDPVANQVLIYDEISKSFVNRGQEELAKEEKSISTIKRLDPEGFQIFNNLIDGVASFKSIRAGDQIRLRNMESYVEIEFAGDAYTFRGKEPHDFLTVENNLQEVNSELARKNISVYSKSEVHDTFMETNASNIPDKDNVYDLGSNGRRYADIFAVTFHGTATRALMADGFRSHGAKNGDYLAWSDNDNGWRPITPPDISLNDISNIEDRSPVNGEILQYNSNNNRWEFTEYQPFTGTADNAITSLQTSGNGVSFVRSRAGNMVELRSIRGSEGVNVATTNFENEIMIDVDIPRTTDYLKEGEENLYFTKERVSEVISETSLQELKDITNDEPSNNKGLIWENTHWVLKDVMHSVYDTDGIPEGSNNLYHTNSRVNTLIDDYIGNGGISIRDLSDVNTSSVSKTWLYFNGLNWVNRPLDTSLVEEKDNLYFTESRVVDVLQSYIPSTSLSDLGDVSANHNNHHVLVSNGSSWTNKRLNTSDIPEGNNKYFTDERAQSLIDATVSEISINDLNDVSISNPENGNIMMYSGNSWNAVDLSYPLFDNYRLKSKTSTSTINIDQASVHRLDGTKDTSINISGSTPSDQAINVIIFIEGFGGNITWPNTINWSNGTEPNLGANWTNVVLFWTGSMWIGMMGARG